MQSTWDTIGLLDGAEAEVLVIDDGSDDATPQILQSLANIFEGRRPLTLHRFAQNSPGGVATPANFGLDRAVGDIVVFLDGDDWVLPDGLAVAITALQASGEDMLVTDCAEFWNDTARYSKWPEDDHWQALKHAEDDAARRAAVLHMAPFPWRKLYRRNFLDRDGIRFPEGDFFFEDNPFHWQVTLRARAWGWLPRETHIHRRARVGQSLERLDRGYLRVFEHFDTIATILRDTGTPARHRPDLADWLLHHIPWVAGRLGLADWPALYDAARARLDQSEGWEALYRANERQWLAPHHQQLIHAVLQGDRAGFLACHYQDRPADPRSQDRG